MNGDPEIRGAVDRLGSALAQVAMLKPRHPLVAPYYGPTFFADQAARAQKRARTYPVP